MGESIPGRNGSGNEDAEKDAAASLEKKAEGRSARQGLSDFATEV
jgi:hypothetical protein